LELPVVTVRWSTPQTFSGVDASRIPARGGVFEILREDGGEYDRLFVGESLDLRRTYVSLIAGDDEEPGAPEAARDKNACFRFWECELRPRRLQVIGALVDSCVYEHGFDEVAADVACIRVVEVD
jgi:hypothetical protein